jgi:hypothetical protein
MFIKRRYRIWVNNDNQDGQPPEADRFSGGFCGEETK